MAQTKTTLICPPRLATMLMDVRLLRSDGQNPNKLTLKPHEAFWQSVVSM